MDCVEALAAEESFGYPSEFCAATIKSHAASSVAFNNAIYCAGAAAALGVVGALAVTSVVGVIFTVARIFSSR